MAGIMGLVLDSESPHPPASRPLGSRREARTEAILRATLEELAEVGYEALSVEAIASRVGVAKTTIYRRYPTRIELVRAAVQQFIDEGFGEPPNTGALRTDLIAIGKQAVQLVSSVLGQGLFRMKLLGRLTPELERLGDDFETEREAINRIVAKRAVARGELSSEADFDNLVHVLSGTLLFKVVFRNESVDELTITHIVDLLLNGVRSPQGRSKGPRG